MRLCIRVTHPDIKKGGALSSWASAALFVPGVSTSPFISWSTGSIWTSLHTIFSISASKSRNSLCLWIMKPPRLHTMAWSTSKKYPYAKVDGVSLICRSYLRWMANKNNNNNNNNYYYYNCNNNYIYIYMYTYIKIMTIIMEMIMTITMITKVIVVR